MLETGQRILQSAPGFQPLVLRHTARDVILARRRPTHGVLWRQLRVKMTYSIDRLSDSRSRVAAAWEIPGQTIITVLDRHFPVMTLTIEYQPATMSNGGKHHGPYIPYIYWTTSQDINAEIGHRNRVNSRRQGRSYSVRQPPCSRTCTGRRRRSRWRCCWRQPSRHARRRPKPHRRTAFCGRAAAEAGPSGPRPTRRHRPASTTCDIGIGWDDRCNDTCVTSETASTTSTTTSTNSGPTTWVYTLSWRHCDAWIISKILSCPKQVGLIQ